MRDSIEVRSYEQRQLLELLPDCIDSALDDDMDERAETLQSVVDQIESTGSGTTTLDLGTEAISDVVIELDFLGTNRASWLSTKLARRSEMPQIYMGYSTGQPVMASIVGKQPTKPS